ncbi:MerR family transcriptional regulator [Paenibacillus oryzisoli]|uniref:MerR family transcriptional regulator n=1 Tax=Paenibacillus oryzisoli TaxID=1850517 RepID=UPI003D28C035
MTNVYTPAQIAEMLQVSTTTLRRYEGQGLIPDVPRTSGSHRSYGPVHLQAFRSIRALLKGFDIPPAYEAMRHVKRGTAVEGLWQLNEQLNDLQEEKRRVQAISEMIQRSDLTPYGNAPIPAQMTIGQAAQLAGVNTSAIRHWEQEGLVSSDRQHRSGYRLYTQKELRKILVIRSLRRTVYYIDNLRELLDDLDRRNLSEIDQAFQLALQHLNEKLVIRYAGIAELMAYISLIRNGEAVNPHTEM